jgi:hypothetical protein
LLFGFLHNYRLLSWSTGKQTFSFPYHIVALCVSHSFLVSKYDGAVPVGPNDGIVQVLKGAVLIGWPFLSDGGSKSTQAHSRKQMAVFFIFLLRIWAK